MRKFAVVLTLSFLFASGSGCTDARIAQIKEALGVADQQMTTAKAVLTAAEDALAEEQLRLATLPDGLEKDKAREQVAALQEIAARAQSEAGVIGGVIFNLNRDLTNVTEASEMLEVTLREIGTVVPAPYGLFLGLAAAMIGAVRAVQVKSAAKNIVKTVDKVLTKEQKKELKVLNGQTKLAKKIVDQAQGKTGLPV